MTRADDPWWRRPATDSSDSPAGPADAVPYRSDPPDPALAYAGPPPSNPPPTAWRPPLVSNPPPPQELPPQDHARIDLEEQAARTLTQGIGMVVGAVAIVLLLVLCARGLF